MIVAEKGECNDDEHQNNHQMLSENHYYIIDKHAINYGLSKATIHES